MKIPLNWLQKYIKLQHTPKEFGDIMTQLEFMQDGPIEEINGEPVIDLEVRQNRPDLLSIIGAAREYAAFVDKPVKYPEEIKELPVEWGEPNKNLSVQATDVVKRFCTVEISNIKIGSSPEWLIKDLESYGIPAINNLVDITNYVMLEYGIPLHAFDKDKLITEPKETSLKLRKAKEGEKFETWQGTKIELTKEDLVVADAEKPVAIAGIIGGANSDIGESTKNIILEGAVYNQATVRRSALRHNLRTDAATRHEKILNPNMVETAIRRALFLINDICGGEIISIEDYYEKVQEPVTVEFNVYEIERLGGVYFTLEDAKAHLERLGFVVVDQREAIGLDKSILTVRVPNWRTDVNIQADLVEEVLRLWGYSNIPPKPLTAVSPDYATPVHIRLEEKIRDILVNLGLDEHITNPLVNYDEDNSIQIKLENPLNKYQDALRTSIKPSLKEVIEFNKKAGKERVAVFEVGKIYYKQRVGEFIEDRRVQTLYYGYDFSIIKADFVSVMTKLGIINKLQWKSAGKKLNYTINDKVIAVLYSNGYEIHTENLVEIVDIKDIPVIKFQTGLTQRILEEITLVVESSEPLGRIASIISAASDYIKEVDVADIYKDAKLGTDKLSTTFHVLFEDAENQLTRDKIEEIKQDMLGTLQSRVGAKLRK